MNLADSKQLIPKKSTKKIGTIKTVKHFTSLVVNAANIASACVNMDVMKSANAECLLIVLLNYFIKFVGADFVAWTQ